MNYTLHPLTVKICFTPPYGVGVNSFYWDYGNGRVTLLLAYHERRKINGRNWHITRLN